MQRKLFAITLLLILTACATSAPVITPSPTPSLQPLSIATSTPTYSPSIPPTTATIQSPTPTRPSSPIPTLSSQARVPEYEVSLELVGQIGGKIKGLAVQGNYAYMGVGLRIAVIDVSIPQAPQLVGQSEILPGLIQAIVVQDGFVYASVAKEGSGYGQVPSKLLVFDVHNDSPLELVGEGDWFQGRISSIILKDGYAYLASRYRDSDGFTGELLVIDVHDPAYPKEILSIPVEKGISSMVEQGNYLYVGTDGVLVFQIADPAQPQLVGTLKADWDALDITVVGDLACVAVEYSLRLIDLSDPTTPVEIGEYFKGIPGPQLTTTLADHVYTVRNYCDAGACSTDLQVFKIGSSPREEWGLQLPSSPAGLVVDDDYLYYAASGKTGGGGLWIVDTSVPDEPITIGILRTLGQVFWVGVSSNYAYVVDGSSFWAVDIKDPATPRLVGVTERDMYTTDVFLSDKYAYVAKWGGLEIVDTSDPTNLYDIGEQIGPLPLGEGKCRLWVEGRYVYIVGFSIHGLLVVLIDDSQLFEQVSHLDADWEGGDLTVVGDYAYIVTDYLTGEQDGGIRIVNVRDPAKPYLVGSLATDWYANSIAVVGNYAYVQAKGGLRVIDLNDLTNPREVAFLPVEWWEQDIVASGNYLYIAASTNGLRIVDIMEPTVPIEVAAFDISGEVRGVAVTDDLVLVAAKDAGLFILRIIQQ